MPATTEQLRDYIIAVLECDGDEAASQRLALREAWRKTHVAGADLGVGEKPSSLIDRATEWSRLETIWQRFETLPVDAEAELKPWLESNWQDVREAAARVVQLRKLREPLAALWPKSLDQSLFVWWLDTLIRPAARRQSLQQSLGLALTATPETAKGFQRFLQSVRKKFPDLDAADLVAEAKTAERPVFAAAAKPVAKPAADKESNPSRTAAIWIAFGLFAFLRLAFELGKSHPPPPTPPPKSSVNPQQFDPNGPMARIMKAMQAEQEANQPQRNSRALGTPQTQEESRRQQAMNRWVTPDGRVRKQPLEPGGNDPEPHHDDRPAVNLRPAQQTADERKQQQATERAEKLAQMREIYERQFAQPTVDPAVLARNQQEMAELIAYFKGRPDAKLFAEEAMKITQEYRSKAQQRLKLQPPAPAAPSEASPASDLYAQRLQRIREILERQLNRRPGDRADLKQEMAELGALISASSVGPGGAEFRAELQTLLENFREQSRLKAEGRVPPADAAQPANVGARKGAR